MNRLILKCMLALVFVFCIAFGQLYAVCQDNKGLKRPPSIVRLSPKDDIKPSKEDKKVAKTYYKEGWKAPVGEKPIEYQLARHSGKMSEMIIADESDPDNAEYVARYYSGTGIAVAGSYNAALSIARTKALGEITSGMETSLVRSIQNKVNVGQTDAVSAITSDNFHEETRALVRQTLANTQLTIAMYRELPNQNYEVSVTMVYDKKDLVESIKKLIRTELEAEGQEFFDEVGDSLRLEDTK